MKRATPRTAKRKAATPRGRSMIRINRAYEPAEPSDGMRILVDRLWPRGMRKEELGYDIWAKELAPSNELRRWYGHDPARSAEFRRRYLAELKDAKDKLAELKAALRGRRATLLTATRELELSHAAVLRDVLMGKR